MEAYLEDNRPTLDEVCMEYEECTKECPAYEFCHSKKENEDNMEDIELVIKIPEKIYKHILSMQFYIPGSRNGKSLLEKILKAIRTGVSLPKGHGRLFDEKDIVNGNYEVIGNRIYDLEPILEANNTESEEK